MEYVKISEVLAIMARRSYAFQDFGGFDDVKREIESLPRSESAKQAHWIGIEHDGYTGDQPVWRVLECSGCGNETDADTNYCPHCGAIMEKEVIPNDSD